MSRSPSPSFVRAARGALCGIIILGLGLALAAPAFADEDLPKFTDPDVTAYIKAYAEFIDQYIAAAKAAKAGDTSKMAGVDAKNQELQKMSEKLAPKLKPEEVERFSDYLSKSTERMANASL